MEIDYESILLSQPFVFVIGLQKKHFIIHGVALARLSKSLENLLNGPMREAKERCVYWEDVDEKTFIQFGRWAYTGDYVPAEPILLLDASHIATSGKDLATKMSKDHPLYSLASFKIPDKREKKSTCQHDTGGYSSIRRCSSCNASINSYYCDYCSSYQPDSCTQCQKSAKTLTKKESMIKSFNASNEFPSPTIRRFTPRKNKESSEDYSEIFLSHARLYTLADKYDIPELRKLSLHKLYVSLKEFTLYPSRIGDIISLVRYAFENTLAGDKLRTLLVDYCTCIIEDMSKSEEFKEAIDGTPDFASGLIKKMAERLD